MISSRISIVTPSFNQGQFIEDAILSVLNQGYDNFEHIIIDACSTDNTIEVLKKYPHLIWVSESDEGQSDAINKGFKMAKGDIIGWLNADDLYLHNTFNHVITEFISSNPDAVYGKYIFIDKNGIETKKMNPIKPNKFISLFNCYIPSTTFFFKRKIIDNGILIDKEFHITMDKEFFVNIIYNNYKIKKINEYLAYFRWHDTNKSINNNEIKMITANEGLKIINRYTKLNFKISNRNAKIYRRIALTVNNYRKFKSLF